MSLSENDEDDDGGTAAAGSDSAASSASAAAYEGIPELFAHEEATAETREMEERIARSVFSCECFFNLLNHFTNRFFFIDLAN